MSAEIDSGPANFASRLLAWFDVHGRHDLPWQHPRTAYRVWIAEIMLQQTQVATVIPYYLHFLNSFPSLQSLASASQDEVLGHWSGLGYYSRARNLHAAAQRCVSERAGELPDTLELLQALPGIGRSTAAAILAQACGQRHAILDGNVKRVLCRIFGIEGWPGSPSVEKTLWPLATALLPSKRLADYTQAIMDFGASQCRRSKPDCISCPFAAECVAHQTHRVAELPQSRPKKVLPQRECTMLVLQSEDGRVLLERRPPVGVWASLWSLPQFETHALAYEYAHSRGIATDDIQQRTAIDHVFSHYRLQITPLHARCAELPLRVADDNHQRWLSRPEVEKLGMPAPVRRIINPSLHEEPTPP